MLAKLILYSLLTQFNLHPRIRQLVRRRAVQGLGTQTAETIVRIVCQSYFGSSQSMLHLAHPVSIVVAVSVYFLSCSLSGSGK